MIEMVGWTLTQTQTTTAVMLFSNFEKSFASIQTFDLKTRRRNFIEQFPLANKPTKLF